MSNDDKPFVCTAPNCTQRFTNEDHLTVHMKKHDMTLTLAETAPSSQHPLFLDQTPTPTKFLRTCEEIGLFQELSKNPFDEAFKKASDQPVDAHEAVPLPGPDSNCKLDTPTLQLSPHPAQAYSRPISKLVSGDGVTVECRKRKLHQVGDVTSSATRVPSIAAAVECNANQPTSTTPDEEVVYITSTDVADSTTPTVQRKPVVPELGVASSTTSPVPQRPPAPANPAAVPPIHAAPPLAVPMQILLQLPTGQTVPLNIPTTLATAQTINTVPVGVKRTLALPTSSSGSQAMPQSLTKQKLKAVIQNSQKHSSPAPVYKEESDSEDDDDTFGSSDFCQQKSLENGMRLGDESEDRRKRFLERNRAAAARCRNKRKMWITGLERKADELQQTNQKLQHEVSQLRSEVSELKLLLMAHKDCPITLQQKSQGQIPLASGTVEDSTKSQATAIAALNLTSEEAIASDVLTTFSGNDRVQPVTALFQNMNDTVQIATRFLEHFSNSPQQQPRESGGTGASVQLVVTEAKPEDLQDIISQARVASNVEGYSLKNVADGEFTATSRVSLDLQNSGVRDNSAAGIVSSLKSAAGMMRDFTAYDSNERNNRETPWTDYDQQMKSNKTEHVVNHDASRLVDRSWEGGDAFTLDSGGVNCVDLTGDGDSTDFKEKNAVIERCSRESKERKFPVTKS